MTNFTILDGSIVGLYLLGCMAAGIMARRYVGRVDQFLVAGREMNLYLGIASLAATEFGIATCMYSAELCGTRLQIRLQRRHARHNDVSGHAFRRLHRLLYKTAP